MDIYKYLKKEYPYFHDEILYFLNSQECIIFGGFVKSILINSKWNNELDVLCYNYKKTLSDFTKLFTPDSIEDIDIHTILHYGNYKIDLCNLFTTNDFSFNCLGLMGENIVSVPNIFLHNIPFLLNQLDNKVGFECKISPNYKQRKEKYKDWTVVERF